MAPLTASAGRQFQAPRGRRAGTTGFLTVLVQEELVESQAAGLFADEAVHILCAVVVHSDGVLQRFDTGLQAERNLGVAHSVPGEETHLL